jgi:hypothetical protein
LGCQWTIMAMALIEFISAFLHRLSSLFLDIIPYLIEVPT